MPTLNGYPTVVGDHKYSVFYTTGPAVYVRVTTGPLANGDVVQPVEGGIKYFDKVDGGSSDSGNFFVEAIPAAANAYSATNKNGEAGITYVLRWMARVTAVVGGQAQVIGTEAAAGTVLSAERVRLSAIGRY